MSFLTYELSRLLGQPVELYQFRWGSATNAVYRYTNAEKAITYLGNVFTPIPIDRNNIVVTGTLDKADLAITVPQTNDLVNMLTVYPAAQPVTCKIWQGHANDTSYDFRQLWIGRVIGVQRKASEATLTCQAYLTGLKRTGLRRMWMYGCPHVLWGTECGANKTANTTTAVLTAVDSVGYTVSVPGAWYGGWDAVRFSGGTMEYTGIDGNAYIVTIQTAGETLLQLAGPPASLAVGRTVSLVRGCDHTLTGGCQSIGNNVNFGGTPWIPYKDPTGIFQNSTY